MRVIDYADILRNVVEMINVLEFNCMRSPGKVKQSVSELNELYVYKERIEKHIKSAKPRKEGN